MFSLFKKEKDNNIYAPIKGKCFDIEEVNDDVFSKKVMGGGFVVKPYENIVYAPCNGKLTMIFPTKHAFGIIMENGVEVLVHIGLDSVNLRGVGFSQFKSKGDKIKQGDKIIEFDKSYLKKEDLDMSVIVVVTNSNNYNFVKKNLNIDVDENMKVMLIEDIGKDETAKEN